MEVYFNNLQKKNIMHMAEVVLNIVWKASNYMWSRIVNA